jgi:hypothetical protein
MTLAASATELERGYEALRAQAVGTTPAVRPRGLAILHRAGLVAWMRALPPGTPDRQGERPEPDRDTALAGLGSELVSILTEMALGAGWGWHGAA